MPVTASATRARLRASAPRAISRAVSSLTAPNFLKVFFETPKTSCLAAFEYVTKPRSNHADEPATEVTACATQPPVHDRALEPATGLYREGFQNQALFTSASTATV